MKKQFYIPELRLLMTAELIQTIGASNSVGDKNQLAPSRATLANPSLISK